MRAFFSSRLGLPVNALEAEAAPETGMEEAAAEAKLEGYKEAELEAEPPVLVELFVVWPLFSCNDS